MRMKEVKITRTCRGSEDGFTVNTYEKGRTYLIAEDLANVFIKQMKTGKASTPKQSEKDEPKTGPTETANKAEKPETPETPKAGPGKAGKKTAKKKAAVKK